jgi:hypothetical protein
LRCAAGERHWKYTLHDIPAAAAVRVPRRKALRKAQDLLYNLDNVDNS